MIPHDLRTIRAQLKITKSLVLESVCLLAPSEFRGQAQPKTSQKGETKLTTRGVSWCALTRLSPCAPGWAWQLT